MNKGKKEAIAARKNYGINKVLEPVKLMDNLAVVDQLANIAVNINKLANNNNTTLGQQQQLLLRYYELLDEIINRLNYSEEQEDEADIKVSIGAEAYLRNKEISKEARERSKEWLNNKIKN